MIWMPTLQANVVFLCIALRVLWKSKSQQLKRSKENANTDIKTARWTEWLVKLCTKVTPVCCYILCIQSSDASIHGVASPPGTDLGIWCTQCQSTHDSLCLVIHYIQFTSGAYHNYLLSALYIFNWNGWCMWKYNSIIDSSPGSLILMYVEKIKEPGDETSSNHVCIIIIMINLHLQGVFLFFFHVLRSEMVYT